MKKPMPPKVATSFAALLRLHRVTVGFSQEVLAAKAGLSRTGISEIERGLKRRPHPYTIGQLAKALNLDGEKREHFIAVALGDPLRALPTTAPAEPYLVRPLAPLAGRRDALSQIEDALEGTATPLCLVTGEPGIGKTRLLTEVGIRAANTGWRVIYGACARTDAQQPYEPFASALSRSLVATPDDRRLDNLEGCAWLASLLPELVEDGSIPAPPSALPQLQGQRLLFRAVARYLANCAGPSGMLLLLDDLQWAGPDAIALLEKLVLAASDATVSLLRIIVAYRSTEVHAQYAQAAQDAPAAQTALIQLAASAASTGRGLRVPLTPLTPDEASELLDSLAQTLPGIASLTEPGETRNEVLQRAGGHPFYLVSYARTPHAHRCTADGQASEVPVSVAESIHARVAPLRLVAKEVLNIAAVAAQPLSSALLLATTHAPEPQAVDALETLCRVGLLQEVAHDRYRVAHDLIREVVERELSAPRRRSIHLRLARRLEQLPEPERARQAGDIAHHYLAADEPAEALPYVLLAGDHARTLHAFAEAEDHYRTALQLALRNGQATYEALAQENLGTLLMYIGKHGDAVVALSAAATRYEAMGDSAAQARVTIASGTAHEFEGTSAEGVQKLHMLLRQMVNNGLSEDSAMANLTMSWLHFFAAEYEEQARATTRGVEVAHGLGDGELVLMARMNEAMAATVLGGGEHRLQFMANLWQDYERVEHTMRNEYRFNAFYSVGTLTVHVGEAYLDQGDYEQAQCHLAKALSLATDLGFVIPLTYSRTWLGLLAQHSGEWGEAEQHFRQAFAEATESGDISAKGYPAFALGQYLLAIGQHEIAENLLMQAHDVARRGSPARLLRRVLGVLAERDLLAGDALAALERLESPLSTRAGRVGTDATALLPLLAWAYLDTGHLEAAERTVRSALVRAREERQRLALLDALRVHALVAVRLQAWDVADAALTESIKLARDLPHPYAEAKLLSVAGQMHAARSERAAARMHFREALDIYARLRERHYATHAEHACANL